MVHFRQREITKLGHDVDMRLQVRDVVVKLVPEKLNQKSGQLFFSELESCMNVDRPSIVFDCSKVLQMDKATVHLLLCCLEEAIKRNGDVKLAAIPAGIPMMGEFTGVDRLFEIFETNAEALNSFRRSQRGAAPNGFIPGSSLRAAQN